MEWGDGLPPAAQSAIMWFAVEHYRTVQQLSNQYPPTERVLEKIATACSDIFQAVPIWMEFSYKEWVMACESATQGDGLTLSPVNDKQADGLGRNKVTFTYRGSELLTASPMGVLALSLVILDWLSDGQIAEKFPLLLNAQQLAQVSSRGL